MNLIENYCQALEIQQRLQSEEFELQQKLPIAERVQKGHSMINLTVDFELTEEVPDFCDPLPEGKAFVKAAHVRCLENMSSFREGSSVVLSLGEYHFLCDVVEDSVRHFVLQPNAFHRNECVLPKEGAPRYNWQADTTDTGATFSILQSVALHLGQQPDVERRINELLSGEYKAEPMEGIEIQRDKDLNDSQNEAMRRALTTDFIHLIQGPPGTGKTYTIAAICQRLVDQGCKVLVSGPTHTAINNCLSKTAKQLKNKSRVVKLGEKYQAAEILDEPDLTRKTRLPMRSYLGSRDLSQDGIVIGATPYSLCYPKSKKLDNWTFDYAIVDEASQMSIPMAVAVMSKCRRVIFVGDHQQLSPIIPTATGNAMFASSIFQFLADHYPTELTLLDVSYRLNPLLLDVPNRLFYDGRLSSNVEIEKPYTEYKGYCSHSEVLTHDASALLFLHDEFDGICHSPYEAGIVAEIVSDLLSNDVPLKEICILTPFRAQVREIRRAVFERGILDEKRVQELFVDTVDRMQGQERDFVIYSTADCNPMEHADRLEFIYDYHRLNVAITRARIKTIVIANSKLFETAKELLYNTEEPPSEALRAGLEAFVKYHELSEKLHFDPMDDSDIWI